MTATRSSFEPPCLALVEPPVPCHDKDDVEQIKSHHRDCFPQVEPAVNNEAHAEGCSYNEKADIAYKALAGDVERADQGHGSRDYRSNETGSTNQLAHGQTRSMCAEGSKSGEDVWTAIAECKQGHASQTLAHAQHARDGVQVDAEEVAGGDADGAEEQGEPEGHHHEGDGLRMGQTAVVEGQVGDDASFLVRAVGEHEGALVGGMMDEAALTSC